MLQLLIINQTFSSMQSMCPEKSHFQDLVLLCLSSQAFATVMKGMLTNMYHKKTRTFSTKKSCLILLRYKDFLERLPNARYFFLPCSMSESFCNA